MDAGDEICLECGADPAPAATEDESYPSPPETVDLGGLGESQQAEYPADTALGVIGDWQLVRRRPDVVPDPPFECFEARDRTGGWFWRQSISQAPSRTWQCTMCSGACRSITSRN